MRTITTLAALTSLSTCLTACLGDVASSRKAAGRTAPTASGPCTKLEKDVTIRTSADLTTLPKTGCYDIYGKLILQGNQITSLVALGGINSVNELDLDHTSLTAIDAKQSIGIYGKLTVTGNARLTNLKQLTFETASTGILIDGNPVLATADVLGLDTSKLTEVDGDLAITGNAALTAVPLKNLTKLTGGLTVSGNGALTSIDVSHLATTGHVDIADNAVLTTLTGFAATTISGDLAIRNNAALTSVGAMSSLYRVTGNLTIDNNAALANLAAFTTTIKFVDQSLTITNNPKLTDLGALKHLQLVGGVTITNNAQLIVCRAMEVDRCVSHPGTAVISNNLSVNCNWQCT
jgi:hypothetical protein